MLYSFWEMLNTTCMVLLIAHIFASSRPTYYEIGVDGGGVEKQKSSGVCVSTGTGSTAWSRNICSLHQSQVRKLLDMVPIRNRDSDADYNRFVADVTQRFSDSYVFGAEEDSMFYSIRDPMQNKIYTCEKPHGFARQITLKSRCWDAALSIDGDTSFAFNDGCSVTLQLFPEDQLRTIQLRE